MISTPKSRPSPLAAALAILALAGTPAGPLGAADGRGVERVPIVDAAGEEVLFYQASHALVIGIADYTAGWRDLPGVRDDVEAVSRVLETHGFEVRREADLDHETLARVIRDFIAERGQAPEARLVIYFAGHGHTLELGGDRVMGYVVPADAPDPEADRAGFVARALPTRQVEVYAETIRSKHALFLFDSCFSGRIFALERAPAAPRHIRARTALPVRQFITSGSAEETVPDESIFRQQLVAALTGDGDTNRDGYVTGAELGAFLFDTVVSYSRATQHPQYGKIRHPRLDKGDIVFRLPSPGPVDKPPPETPPVQEDPESEADRVEEPWKGLGARLKEMQTAFDRAADYEDQSVDPARKAEAWRRFISAFGGDDPFTVLRKQGAQRLAHWRQAAMFVEQAPAPAPEPPAEPKPGDGWTDPALGLRFRYVPAGTFRMGSPESEKGRDGWEKLHAVTLTRGFWIGETEVTQEQFERFVAATGYRTEAEKEGWSLAWTGSEWGRKEGVSWRRSGGAEHPVVHVSWNDAQAFCAWASRETGVEIHLPTEADWERAARAGTGTATYAGNLTLRGDCDAPELDAIAWYCGNSGSASHPVGGKAANGWGLHDMLGNAWEWVEDAADLRRRKIVTTTYVGDAKDPLSTEGSRRVIRGGSWVAVAPGVRASVRGAVSPDHRGLDLGFRLVLGGARQRGPRWTPR